jgi:hypothetical protein
MRRLPCVYTVLAFSVVLGGFAALGGLGVKFF